MESRNNISSPQTDQTVKENTNTSYDRNIKRKDSLKDRVLAYFKRDRLKSDENVGFINRQVPGYWHGK